MDEMKKLEDLLEIIENTCNEFLEGDEEYSYSAGHAKGQLSAVKFIRKHFNLEEKRQKKETL